MVSPATGARQPSPEWATQARIEIGLERPLSWSGEATIPDLVECLARDLGARVLASREAWEHPSPITIRKGETGLGVLDRLSSDDFRWAVRDGILYLLKKEVPPSGR
jgi:hypothetical protein